MDLVAQKHKTQLLLLYSCLVARLNNIFCRHEMFIKLEQSIKELHEMFMDISVLIENQGEMVNR